VIEEPANGQLLVAAVRQRVNASGWLLTHRIQQFRADTLKTCIPKAPKIFLQPANRPPANVRSYRIVVYTLKEIVPHMRQRRSWCGRGGAVRCFLSRSIRLLETKPSRRLSVIVRSTRLATPIVVS